MSRIGNIPVPIPAGVKVSHAGGVVTAEGPRGRVELRVHPDMTVRVDGGRIAVSRPSDSRRHKALHGLTRALLANLVRGAAEGYEKKLELHGVGYNAKVQGNTLVISAGFIHPVAVEIPAGLTVTVPNPNLIVVSGADKQRVGQFAADVRAIRPPEPYNMKGIKYDDEVVRRKAGKTFVSGGA
jgi:large subunit ribosomal protein L6